ncbi:hypothetical protein NDU88_007676 [Pleurodeles waltl]|uniref:Uncharacterized protein n=1 Tax=Pleurodeles waltl TaxID=8319 RepID=A0AAV7RTQ7_PLEWA|nr:hypothetical protein NDU88_007676 [Pleurodeles waltl]
MLGTKRPIGRSPSQGVVETSTTAAASPADSDSGCGPPVESNRNSGQTSPRGTSPHSLGPGLIRRPGPASRHSGRRPTRFSAIPGEFHSHLRSHVPAARPHSNVHARPGLLQERGRAEHRRTSGRPRHRGSHNHEAWSRAQSRLLVVWAARLVSPLEAGGGNPRERGASPHPPLLPLPSGRSEARPPGPSANHRQGQHRLPLSARLLPG